MARSIKNLIAAVLISISCFLVWTRVLSAYTLTSFLEQRIEERSMVLATRNEIYEKIEKIRAESSAKYSELQRLAIVIPEEKNFPGLISAMESIYSKSGISLPELNINEAKSTDQLGKISIEVRNEGTYSQFLNLLRNIEKNTRIIELHDIAIGLTSDSKTAGLIDPVLSIVIKGEAYWINTSAKANPLSGAAGVADE